jgi:hypothetical protein
MSFCLRHSTARARRGQTQWSSWLWSGGAWVVLGSTIFRGGALESGPGLASWGPGAGVSDALIAHVNQSPAPSAVTSTPRLVPLPQFVIGEAGAAAQAQTLGERTSRWRSLRAELRQFIDGEAREGHRWTRLVVDDTGEAFGNAADLAFRRSELSSTNPTSQPHFVIGNGSRSHDGEIESTGRGLTEEALRIVLIADLEAAPPTAAQLHGLTELIDYLRAKVGVIPVRMGTEATTTTADRAALPQKALDLAFNQSLADTKPLPTRPAHQ